VGGCDGQRAQRGTNGGAYALDASRQPVRPRSGPYIDGDKVPMSEAAGGSRFVIPAEKKAMDSLGLGPNPFRYNRTYPMYLDGFGYPILYYKADTAGRQMVGQYRNDSNYSGEYRGIYWSEDNESLVNSNLDTALVLNEAGVEHALDWHDGNYQTSINASPQQNLITLPGNFVFYVWNQNVKARYQPHKSDAYLLVSPGYDGLYGTADDVANFEHGGY
jgi:hypothetical protein